MTNSKAPWLTRGGAIALMAAAAIALAACSGGGGLNEDEAAGLQQELEDARADAAAALADQQLEEAARIAAEAAQALAVAEKLKAETEKVAAETARDAAVALAEAAEKSAAAAAASAQDAADALVEALAAQQVAEDAKDAAEAAQQDAEDAAAEADRLRRLAVAATDTEERRRQQAEAEQDRLEQVAEDAEQLANQAQARTAHIGLGGSEDNGMRSDSGTVSVTPRYGQTAVVTTTPSVDFSSERRSSSGRWSITTLSNAGGTHNDDLVVYSDMGAPTREPIREVHSGDFTDVMGSTSRIMITIDDDDHADLIASSQFPGGGNTKEFPFTIDSDPTMDSVDDDDTNPRNDYDTVRFSGSFDGASGTFECMDAVACKIKHLGGSRYSVDSTSWTFTTSRTATVSVDDDSYMYFGWWRRMELADESFDFEMFSGGAHEVNDIPDTLIGTATYTGLAAGQYAIYQPLGTQSGTGSFTARAELTANFGDATSEGTLSGRVTNFSNASDWSVALRSDAIDSGNVTDGGVSWTIAGNTEDGGMWDAKFFSDVDGHQGYPEGVAGTFDARFNEVGRLIGAFGAHCPTSTCPRN